MFFYLYAKVELIFYLDRLLIIWYNAFLDLVAGALNDWKKPWTEELLISKKDHSVLKKTTM